jgi:hypothetical protein
MRDIRDDIKERIAEAKGEEARLDQELEKIITYIADLEALLVAEDARHKANGESVVAAPKPTEDMDKFIVRMAKRQPPTKPEIAVAVQQAGYIKPGQSAGRVVHGKLLGMVNDKILRLRSDKKYEVYQ